MAFAKKKVEELKSIGLWKRRQAAEYYGVSERTIDRWILTGVLPGNAKVSIGGTVRFRAEVMVEHIDGLGCSPKSESEVSK